MKNNNISISAQDMKNILNSTDEQLNKAISYVKEHGVEIDDNTSIKALYEKLNETLSFKDDISNSTVTVSLSLSKLNFVSTSLSFTIPFIAVNIFPFVNVITMYFFPSTVFNLLLFKNFWADESLSSVACFKVVL